MTRSITFGRAPASATHIHVADDYCSPVHCRITQTLSGQYTVQDCGSTNGTYIVMDARLSAGNRQGDDPPRMLGPDRADCPAMGSQMIYACKIDLAHDSLAGIYD